VWRTAHTYGACGKRLVPDGLECERLAKCQRVRVEDRALANSEPFPFWGDHDNIVSCVCRQLFGTLQDLVDPNGHGIRRSVGQFIRPRGLNRTVEDESGLLGKLFVGRGWHERHLAMGECVRGKRRDYTSASKNCFRSKCPPLQYGNDPNHPIQGRYAMFELLPIIGGLLIGSTIGYIRPEIRVRVVIVLALVIGLTATVVSGEYKVSGSFLLVDVSLVLVSATVAFRTVRSAVVGRNPSK
jgi:hypothetical protein